MSATGSQTGSPDTPAEAITERTLRPATAEDFGHILRLNAEWEHVTSPLDEGSLGHLHEHSLYHHVAEVNGEIAGFLLALGRGAPYASENYRWFERHSSDFIYIDRVVIAGEHQRAGLGDAFYDDLMRFASERGVGRLVCEVDIEPFNARSDSFHVRRGFTEVGTQRLSAGKRVSLRECAVGR